MGYSSRYHAASLAAVFVALAIGILIGAALGSDVISGTAENLEEDLGEDLDQLRAENADLAEELQFERALEEQLYPAVVGDRLSGMRIALVGIGDIDTTALKDDIEAALRDTGGELAAVGSVREPPDTDALVDALVPPVRRLAGQRDGLELAARRAGQLLAGNGGALGEALGVLFSGFSGAARGIDAVVVARQRPDDLSPRETTEIEKLETGLIAGIRDGGARMVGAERSDSEPSSIGFFSELGLATVDNADQLAGRVALVLALDGADGDFGVKDTADSLLPELITRAGGTASGRG